MIAWVVRHAPQLNNNALIQLYEKIVVSVAREHVQKLDTDTLCVCLSFLDHLSWTRMKQVCRWFSCICASRSDSLTWTCTKLSAAVHRCHLPKRPQCQLTWQGAPTAWFEDMLIQSSLLLTRLDCCAMPMVFLEQLGPHKCAPNLTSLSIQESTGKFIEPDMGQELNNIFAGIALYKLRKFEMWSRSRMVLTAALQQLCQRDIGLFICFGGLFFMLEELRVELRDAGKEFQLPTISATALHSLSLCRNINIKDSIPLENQLISLTLEHCEVNVNKRFRNLQRYYCFFFLI